MKTNCVLKHVAGKNWLIRIDQDGLEYIPPVVVNDCGAEIWSYIQEGASIDEVAEKLHTGYGIELQNALEDVSYFIQQLREKHILSD